MPHRSFRIAAVALTLAAPAAAQRPANQSSDLPPGFDAYVARALDQLHAPGAAVAIVKDGKVLLERGYGYRDLARHLPVDAHTRFQIASNTKAFTAAALAILATDGKVKWSDRVVEHLPGFALSDPYVTHEMTITDLLSHHSGLGLGAGDLLWLHSSLDRREIVRRLRYIDLASSFRSRYAYDNVLYDAAGELIEAASGTSWEEFIAQRIFRPLGMSESRTSITDLGADADVALPYGRRDGKTVVVSYDTVTNLAPGGGIVSSVSDLSRWLRVQLDSGRTASGRLWRESDTREMWAPQTIIRVGNPAPELSHLRPNFEAYGLGWHLKDYRGHKIVTHSGGLAGMISQTFLVPDLDFGVVVLTNGESSAATAIAERVVDHYVGAPAFDYVSAIARVNARADSTASAKVARATAARAARVGPSLPLAHYAGRYVDPWLGDATIADEGGKLVLRFASSPAFVGELEHWQYDTFVARWRSPELPDAFVTFALNPDGSIAQMTMAPFDPQTDFSYDYQDLRFTPAAPAAR